MNKKSNNITDEVKLNFPGGSALAQMVSNMPPEPNKEAAFVGSAVKENVSE